MDVERQNCPWCGNEISSEKFAEITTRIREEERKRLAQTEASLRKQLSSEKLLAEQKAAEQIAVANAQLDAALAKLKDADAREAQIRREVREEALRQTERNTSQQLQEQKDKFDAELAAAHQRAGQAETREATARSEARAQALREVEANLNAERDKVRRLDVEKAAVAKEKDAALSQVTQIREESENQLKAVRAEADQQYQKELSELRAVLEADRNQSLLKKQSEFTREREKWQKEILELQHKVENKTANEIGDGAEIDLFEALKEEFETDSLTRVKKGQPGPDIRHEIRHNGERCGLIVYDSKNRQDWKDAYATKLRQDQLDAQAEHAILTSTVFPRGKKELSIESEVIVINPARAVHLVLLLRRALVLMHVRGLSFKARAEKTEQLYALINSGSYQQRFQQIGGLTDEALDLDVEEQKAHQAIWKRRGTMLKRQSALLRELDTEVNAIIEGQEASRKPAA